MKREETDRFLFERKKIDLLTGTDRLAVLIFFISLVASLGAWAAGMHFLDMGMMELPMFITMPLVAVGAYEMILSRRWIYLIVVIVLTVALFAARVDIGIIGVLALISVGIIGAVALVAVIQRAMFYRVVASVEYLNVNEHLTLWDRVVAFAFDISGDLDTRNLEINENVKRASLPWTEIWSSMKISFLIGVFIWIYLSLNPSWMQLESFSSVPVYLFAVMMYIPLIVLPFSIFMSLNVRIETRHRPFRIYDGIKATLMRMAIPVFAAFMYILVAVNKNGFQDVLGFIALSVVFNLFICVLACFVYYRQFESRVIDSIISRWNSFRPVPLLMGVKSREENIKENVPGTPRRDYSDMGELVFPDQLT